MGSGDRSEGDTHKLDGRKNSLFHRQEINHTLTRSLIELACCAVDGMLLLQLPINIRKEASAWIES
jgi:hypothetical protein